LLISRRYQRLLFTLVLVLIAGVLISRALDKVMGRMGNKAGALALRDELMRVKSRDEYLRLLERALPPDSPAWNTPALAESAQPATAPTSVEMRRDGRLHVLTLVLEGRDLLAFREIQYLPAALIDDRGQAYRLEDVRLNARKTDIVLEYIFASPDRRPVDRSRRFQFLYGRRRWDHLEIKQR
jgi:hypothetical protein